MVQPDRPHVTIRLTRTACRISKATDTHSEYCFSTATIVKTPQKYIACILPVLSGAF